MKIQQNMNATIQDIKTQIGQLANTVSHLKSAGCRNLPSQTILNLRGNASALPRSTEADFELDANSQVQQQEKTVPLFFPTWIVSARKSESDEELVKMFCKVEINIPLLDAIIKQKYCSNQHSDFNLQILEFGDLEPTGMIIQLSNRSIVQTLGILEDVLVQVNELIFPTDFYVLDMEDETSGKQSTLILGRPFLMTATTKIDVHAGMLSMEFGDTLVQFNIFEAIKHPIEDHSLFGIDLIDELVEEYFQLDSHNEDIDNFFEKIDLIDCLGEVHNLSDSVDNTNDIADLDFEAELLEVLDQVCKHEKSKCSIEVEVQVAETENLFSTQLENIFTIEDELAKGNRDQERTEAISAKNTTVKTDLHVQMHAETISAKED
ncbi:hypothetical protein CR513_28869, partial [Mucuna pruriens]